MVQYKCFTVFFKYRHRNFPVIQFLPIFYNFWPQAIPNSSVWNFPIPPKSVNPCAKFGNRFAKLQGLARSSGIGLQNCKDSREVRELVCKIAKARAKFGNWFAKLQRLARSSGIGLQNCKSSREVRRSLCIIISI